MRRHGDKAEGRAARHATVIAAAVLLLVFAAAVLTACAGKPDELPSVAPHTWEDDLEFVAGEIASRLALEGNEINLTLNMRGTAADGSMVRLNSGINYDLTNADAGVLGWVLTIDGLQAASVVSTNSETYVDIAPNDFTDNAKLKITGLGMFDLLAAEWSGDGGDAVDAFAGILVSLGKAFFRGVSVDADGAYVFDIDPDFRERGGEYLEAATAALGGDLLSMVTGALGVDGAEGLLGLLPEASGKIVVRFGSAGVTIEGRGLTVSGGSTAFKAEFSSSYERDEDLDASVPTSSDGYVVTKLGNTHMQGTVDLYDGEYRLVRYEYELDADLDIMKLMLGGYDLSALPEDNALHFRLSHRCTAACGSYCEDKESEPRGAVVDLAFSPAEFGTHNIYISVNIGAVLESSYVAEKSDLAGVSLSSALPEYILFALTPDNAGADSTVMRLFRSLVADKLFTTETTEVPLIAIADEAAGSALGELVTQLVYAGSYTAERAVITPEESAYGQAAVGNVYNKTVWLIADDVSEVKDYGTDSPLFGLEYLAAVSWEYEADAEAQSGEKLTNIYDADGNLVHGVSGGQYVPMSAEEAEGLTGMYLRATYTECDGSMPSEPFAARIVEVKGLDASSTEVQEITLKAIYPNPFAAGEIGLAYPGASEQFTTTLTARIKLTPLTRVRFEQDIAEGTEFRLATQQTAAPAFMRADISMTYRSGVVKTLSVVGESDAVVETDSIFFKRYSTVQTGEIEVTFEAAGRRFTRNYTVKEPDEIRWEIDEEEIGPFSVGQTLYMARLTNEISMIAVYRNPGGASDEVDVLLRAADFYINGVPLSSSSADWESRKYNDNGGYTVTFLRSSNYSCKVIKNGVESEPFTLPVQPRATAEPTYEWQAETELPATLMAGAEYDITGAFVNKTHGVTDEGKTDYTVSVSIGRGSVSATTGGVTYTSGTATASENGGAIFSSADGTAWAELTEFELDGRAVSGSASGALTLPDMITSPIPVGFTLKFTDPGFYRVTLRAKPADGVTLTYTVDIYVASP